MSKVYREGIWWHDLALNGWVYYPPGYYEEMVIQEPTQRLSSEQTHQLIKALDQAGWIKPRLDERIRAEDLKITHRLLDLLERGRKA